MVRDSGEREEDDGVEKELGRRCWEKKFNSAKVEVFVSGFVGMMMNIWVLTYEK